MEKFPIKFIWHYVKIFKLYFISMILLILLSQICGQSYPYFLAKIYDTAAGKVGTPNYWEEIIKLGVLAFVLGLGRIVFLEWAQFLSADFWPETRTLVIRDTFDYVNKHSIAYFNSEMSGNISNKVNHLQNGVLEFFMQAYGAVYGVMFIGVGMIILSIISWYFFAVLALWLGLIVGIGAKLGKKRFLYSKETSRQQSVANAMIVDSLANYSEIKSFANFKFERMNLLKYLRMLRKSETKEQKMKAWIHCSQNVMMIFSMACFMLVSIYALYKDSITTTEFIFANSIFAMMAGSIFDVSWLYNNISRVYGQIASALDILATEPDIKDKPNAKKINTSKATIKFENVSFAYTDKGNLFEGLNLEIKAGEKIGLVGHSGSGKSTFIKLLARYFDINQGKICINNIDIRDIAQDSLHKNISTIPQDVCLFNRTLLENIQYGRTNASKEDIFKAAKRAGADEFIKSFPQGYQTKVGERGVVLSGGERQRIAIARAILKNAPILVFDEATSALDSSSEKHIQKSLKNVMKNKTVIAVAHRLSTLREMDRILVFEKGKIVEEGTHMSLLRKKGVYAKLYKMQADGFVA